jgi:hypothetical protein
VQQQELQPPNWNKKKKIKKKRQRERRARREERTGFEKEHHLV